VLFGPKGDGAIWNGRSKSVFAQITSWWGEMWN
jgi:hypothetical protein